MFRLFLFLAENNILDYVKLIIISNKKKPIIIKQREKISVNFKKSEFKYEMQQLIPIYHYFIKLITYFILSKLSENCISQKNENEIANPNQNLYKIKR